MKQCQAILDDMMNSFDIYNVMIGMVNQVNLIEKNVNFDRNALLDDD